MKAIDLKNSILQLAIEGKLVPQDPTDEPASVLYEQIQTEKNRLIKEGKIKAPKKNGRINPAEPPFEIPASWIWVKLGDLLYVLNGVSYDKAEVVPNGVRILRGGNIQNGKIIPDNSDVFLPQTYYDYERNLQQNDIVIVASTGSKSVIGKAGFVLENMPNTQIGAFLRLLRPISPKIAEYLRLIFSSEFYRQHIRDSVSGININNIKNEYVTEFLVPLPPLSEQNRIVDKIEELEPLVDRYGNVAEELARLISAV